MSQIELGFIESEMRTVGSLSPLTVASTVAVFNAAGEQVSLAANSTWVVVMFQAHLLAGGSGNSATAQLINLTTGEVFATLVLTQAGSYAIENQGREFGPIIHPTNGSMQLTCRAISATNSDQIAVLANLEQAFGDPVSA